MAARAVAKSALGGVACGAFLYLVGDTVNDFYIYNVMHDKALQLAAEDKAVVELVGTPFKSGAWYNATLGFSHHGQVAHCSFQLTGSKRTTDVAVKAGRQLGGYRSRVLYNLLGPGTWELLSCQAMVPEAGGLVKARSLMPEHQQQQGSSGAGGVQHPQGQPGCLECQLPAKPASAAAAAVKK